LVKIHLTLQQQFEALRKTLICKDIVESLARCHKWDASGGKSGQKFLKTKGELSVGIAEKQKYDRMLIFILHQLLDERYLIKGISKVRSNHTSALLLWQLSDELSFLPLIFYRLS
jgi:hypothetical protein